MGQSRPQVSYQSHRMSPYLQNSPRERPLESRRNWRRNTLVQGLGNYSMGVPGRSIWLVTAPTMNGRARIMILCRVQADCLVSTHTPYILFAARLCTKNGYVLAGWLAW